MQAMPLVPAVRGAPPAVNLVRAAVLEERLAGVQPWGLASLAGRLAELSGPGGLSFACGLVLQAQARGEPACWVAAGPAIFFPPDMAANGVALDRLPVVRVADAPEAARAADRLLRSGAFGLVVVDLAGQGAPGRLRPQAQARLAQLARRHDTALLFLADEGSIGESSTVSLRARCRSERVGEFQARCALRPLKDKRRGTGWRAEETRHGPPGLR
jgi:recombination protein RecA